MMTQLNEYLAKMRKIVDEKLKEYLPPLDEYPKVIHESMHYSVFSGGKRIRPILVIAATEAVGGESGNALPAASAIELIHTYSLIHDDLPSLDNDDYRRGKLSSHKKFGEAIAILTGDALLSLAFEIIGKEMKNPVLMQKVLSALANSIGTRGMIGGQVVDIQSVGCSPNASTLHYIHTHKTGALICASVRIGALIGGAEEGELAVLSEYGERIGLAFQLADDILDWKKEKKNLTYPALYGLEATKKEKKRLIEEAIELLMDFGKEADPLRWIATFIGEGKW